ncbi:nucleotide exchange factor GrpE [bacterium]|nr:nucleotide exchange factor GrpE [bacterium]
MSVYDESGNTRDEHPVDVGPSDAPSEEEQVAAIEKEGLEGESTDDAAALKSREQELLDHLQRLMAEFDNYKKKNAREYERGVARGVEKVVLALLPAWDSLRLASEAARTATDAEAIGKGVEAVTRQMQTALESIGVAEICPERGDRLDPALHDVMLAQPTDDFEPDAVIETFQSGFRLADQVIRPAKVKVARATDA